MKTVLLVEDDRALLNMYRQVLMSVCNVEIADNGKRALELMSQSRPDLVLLDLDMPEMTGFEVLDAMNSQGIKGDVPVVVLTNVTDDALVKKVMQSGAEEYIDKGNVELSQLKDVCRKYLEG